MPVRLLRQSLSEDNLHLTTVTMERVFDIIRDKSRNGRVTTFSFTSNAMPHYGVAVSGWPALDAGMRITAVLRKPGNWQTIEAWVNHGTGELVAPSLDRPAFFLGLLIALCVGFAASLMSFYPLLILVLAGLPAALRVRRVALIRNTLASQVLP